LKTESGKGADIRARAFEYGVAVLALHRRIYRAAVDLRETSRQAMSSATAVGAMLEEADAAQSKADFISKCTIALKEARESRYWLRMLRRVYEPERKAIDDLGAEATQIIAILTTIVKNTRGDQDQ
jgi:four helix bundle protein